MKSKVLSTINSFDPVIHTIKGTSIEWGLDEPSPDIGNPYWGDECRLFLAVGGPREERRVRLMKCLPRREGMCFMISEEGRPYLEDGPFFSLSHTNVYSILAISRIYQIGIDIEIDRTIRFAKQIASRFFHPAERKLLERKGWTSPDFLKIWVIKEAIVKSKGQSFLRTCRMIDSGAFRAGYMKYRIDRDYLHIAINIFNCPEAQVSKL